MPFADRALLLGRCSIECKIDQFHGRSVAWEVGPSADDLRVQDLNRIRGVDRLANLGGVTEERDAPATCQPTTAPDSSSRSAASRLTNAIAGSEPHIQIDPFLVHSNKC